MRRDRTERRRVSAKRRVETHKTGGGSNYLKLPDGFSFLTIEEKHSPYRLDFMPFKVGKGNPFADPGDEYYERTFFIHRGIGPNNEWHLCAARTLKKPCPICEYRADLARDPDADEQLIKELAPKERQLWLPRWLEEPDENYVWEFSFHNFGKALDAKIKNADEEDGYDFFADPVDGWTIRASFEQVKMGPYNFIDCTDIEFRPRKSKYPANIADEMPCLDELLMETPYDRLKVIFLQTDEDDDNGEDEKEEKPKRSGRKPKREEPEDLTADDAGLEEGMMVDHSKFGRCEIVRISKDGTSLLLVDEDGDSHKAVGCADVVKSKPKKGKVEDDEDDGWDDEPEEKPEPRKGRVKKTAKDDDEDWDDDPPKKSTGKTAKSPAKQSKKSAKDDDDDWDDWD